MKTTGLLLALVLVSAAIAQAEDYYVYKDAAGRNWLSNQDPRNKDESPTRRPDDDKIAKQYRWEDDLRKKLRTIVLVLAATGAFSRRRP
jgi:hypothetical protein